MFSNSLLDTRSIHNTAFGIQGIIWWLLAPRFFSLDLFTRSIVYGRVTGGDASLVIPNSAINLGILPLVLQSGLKKCTARLTQRAWVSGNQEHISKLINLKIKLVVAFLKFILRLLLAELAASWHNNNNRITLAMRILSSHENTQTNLSHERSFMIAMVVLVDRYPVTSSLTIFV